MQRLKGMLVRRWVRVVSGESVDLPRTHEEFISWCELRENSSNISAAAAITIRRIQKKSLKDLNDYIIFFRDELNVRNPKSCVRRNTKLSLNANLRPKLKILLRLGYDVSEMLSSNPNALHYTPIEQILKRHDIIRKAFPDDHFKQVSKHPHILDKSTGCTEVVK